MQCAEDFLLGRPSGCSQVRDPKEQESSETLQGALKRGTKGLAQNAPPYSNQCRFVVTFGSTGTVGRCEVERKREYNNIKE